jgi:hypothetical protein
MDRRRGLARMTTLLVVVSLPLLGLSGMAAAKAPAGKGSPGWCLTHAKKAVCKAAGGTGSGTGPSTAAITVEVDPNPLVETGQSEVTAVVQVETSPSYAGAVVDISSSQLEASCGLLLFNTVNFANANFDQPTLNNIQVALDDDGNATVAVQGTDCAPGPSTVEADMESAPYLTAITVLNAEPPVTTTAGVSGYPQTAGVAQEVETGDSPTSGNSDVYAVFYVETDPVYAEQTVEIDSLELESACGLGWVWIPGNGGTKVFGKGFDILNASSASTTLDDDGNAVFLFMGTSCAASTYEVIADVEAGTHTTYTTTFTVIAPEPTI